ncbi:formylglycine-generating enzyme family protein [Zoogloea sp.]|uniref:formylglycine-generating enzyme family protein n=1 Tax=Zoogloea sp. TaxID=49181 RepID=UPI00345BB4E0
MAAARLAYPPLPVRPWRRVIVKDSRRVLRGGSWNNNAQNCRSAYRNNNPPDEANHNIGFRLAPAQKPESPPLTRLSSCPWCLLGLRQKPKATRCVSRACRSMTESPPGWRPRFHEGSPG